MSQQETPEGPTLVMKDPSSGRFFRFKEVEGFVLEHLDGETSAESICRMVEEKFAATLSPQHVHEFTERLFRLGLLVERDQPHSVAQSKRVRGNPFYLRMKVLDPDRLFDRMTWWLRPLFTPAFVIVSSIVILAGLSVTVANWNEVVRDVISLFHVESLLFVWVIAMVVITMHEFAHGLTCKHFGGKVNELGFMLIYLQPAFYCNVSDAWLFPERSKRLWVTFAGAYFEIFVWGLATLAWRITDPSTLPNHVALVVMATSGIKSLFNLNPLIKLDGYYLLIDYLGIPNLRAKAFTYFGNLIRGFWGARVNQQNAITPREKRIYLTYSILAGSYSYWLFGLILSWLVGFLVAEYQGWGFVLFLALVMVIFRSSITRLFRMGTDKPAAGIQQPRFSRKMKLGVVFALAALFIIFYKTDLRVSGEFVILPVHNAEVRTTVSGIIDKVYCDEGDAVDEGAPIVRLSDRDVQAELEKIKAQTAEKEAKLRLLKAGARREEITLARTLVQKGEERLKYARKDLEMDRELFARDIIAAKKLSQSEGDVVVREKELQEANDRLRILLAGNRKEEIDATEAEVSSLQTQDRFLSEQLRRLTILSPISGTITTHKLREKLGQNLAKGELVAEVHELKNVEAEIMVSEKEIGDVGIGQRVVLKARAFPQLDFEGTVISIAPTATKRDEPGSERTILVVTKLENPSMLLKTGMSGNGKIYCSERRMIEIIGRRFVRFFRVEFWSWW